MRLNQSPQWEIWWDGWKLPKESALQFGKWVARNLVTKRMVEAESCWEAETEAPSVVVKEGRLRLEHRMIEAEALHLVDKGRTA